MTLTEDQRRKIEQNRLKAIDKRQRIFKQRKQVLKIAPWNDRKLVATKNLTMNKLRGDLIKLALKGDFDVIVHGCNCFCTMGAGIALTIKSTFPDAYQADLKTSKGDRSKLGSYSTATVQNKCHEITVVNAYTQYHYSGPGKKADYEAIRVLYF